MVPLMGGKLWTHQVFSLLFLAWAGCEKILKHHAMKICHRPRKTSPPNNHGLLPGVGEAACQLVGSLPLSAGAVETLCSASPKPSGVAGHGAWSK